MSKPIFPPEIIENSVEAYHTQIRTNSKIIYGIILLLIVIVFLLLPLVKVDVTTQSRGVIRTPYENNTVQSAIYGEIVCYGMYENKQVSKGDTLLILNSRQLNEQSLLAQSKYSENIRFINDLNSLISGRHNVISTPKYKSILQQYQSNIDQQKVSLNYLEKEMQTDKSLSDKKVVSEYEYLQAKNNYDKALEQLTVTKQENLANWQAELSSLQIENQEYISNIQQIKDEKQQYIILAPVTGVLTQVAGFQKGSFIAPSQTLAYISSNDSLIAECYISPSDIGYIRENQKVNFQFDAFNYRDWGMIQGNVTQILHDVVMIDNKPMFRVRCKLDKTFLKLKNSYQGNIQKGLTFTARFYLTRRTLWDLLFDKLDNWLNPKMIDTGNESKN